MTKTHETPLGEFNYGREYREALIANGYKDFGWQNGWNKEQEDLWKLQKSLDKEIEVLSWSWSGSNTTVVLHKNKVFCSVDMG
jgi:hypothetical protein